MATPKKITMKLANTAGEEESGEEFPASGVVETVGPRVGESDDVGGGQAASGEVFDGGEGVAGGGVVVDEGGGEAAGVPETLMASFCPSWQWRPKVQM